ncbi:MAG: thiamine pyrophosphate-binding protein [Alphaproteobacteria bacterium]|nr:thiamine pyrophosphate-binding protein [Alphaproteobacteria bacterium]
MKTGAKILVEALALHKVERVFAVAGESYLPVLDALLDAPQIQVITCRHESGATFMAEAYGLLQGDKPGIAFVTRGPGACNAAIGIHAAKQSSSPLVMFVGLVAREGRDRESFQEFDLPQMFASHTKWAAVIDSADRVAEYVARAMHIAVSGRPGPVVLGLPEDMLAEAVGQSVARLIPPVSSAVAAPEVTKTLDWLAAAKKPLVIVGGTNWNAADCDNLAAFARSADLPIAAAFRRHDIVDHREDCYVGELGTGPNPKLVESAAQADVLLVLGARLDEITTQGYSLPKPGQKIIHVYPDAAEFGKSCIPDMAVQADIGAFVAALAAQGDEAAAERGGWREKLRAQYVAWSGVEAGASQGWSGADMTAIFGVLRDLLPKEAIITTDAGNFSGWAQRYLRYGRPGRLLAPISGAMGYAVPAAISAALAHPDRLVLGICGDGGFMMTGQELATAIHHAAKPVIMICNNAMFGTIRMHQERDFPGRVSATTLTNPDFVALARSYGAFGASVSDAAQFETVWKAALASEKLAVIEIRMDPRQITTRSQLSD